MPDDLFFKMLFDCSAYLFCEKGGVCFGKFEMCLNQKKLIYAFTAIHSYYCNVCIAIVSK